MTRHPSQNRDSRSNLMPTDAFRSGQPLKTVASVSLLLLCCGLACSKKDLTEMADSVKKQGESLVKESKKMTDSLVETAKEQLPESGEIKLELAEPLELSQAIIKMHVIGDGRMNSLQITSYTPGEEKIAPPAVFVQATTEIETVALLAGKSIPCNLFVEPALGSPIASNDITSPVTLVFSSMNMQEQTIRATIDPCTLVGSDGKLLQVNGGEILAVVQSD